MSERASERTNERTNAFKLMLYSQCCRGTEHKLSPNSHYTICCGFVVQQAVQQIHSKSRTNRKSTTNPPQLQVTSVSG